jgi:hypothetical protein
MLEEDCKLWKRIVNAGRRENVAGRGLKTLEANYFCWKVCRNLWNPIENSGRGL